MSLMHSRDLVLVWAALMVATLVSWIAGPDHGAVTHGAQGGAIVALALAFLKIRYVGLEFMELRHAPPVLRWGVEVWVVAVGGALIVLYLVA